MYGAQKDCFFIRKNVQENLKVKKGGHSTVSSILSLLTVRDVSDYSNGVNTTST